MPFIDLPPKVEIWLPPRPSIIRRADDIAAYEAALGVLLCAARRRASSTFSIAKVSEGYSSTSSNVTTFSGLSLGAAAASRIMIALVHYADGSVAAKTIAVTIKGVAAAVRVSATEANVPYVGIFTAAVPAGTSGDVVVTVTSVNANSIKAVHLYRMVGQASAVPHDTAAANAAATSVAPSINCPAGGYIIGGETHANPPTYAQGYRAASKLYASAQTALTIGGSYSGQNFTFTELAEDTPGYGDGIVISGTTRMAYAAVSFGP